MTQKRILSLVLAFMMVLTLLPTATAESQQEDTVVYGYSIGGTEFYTCDQNGVPNLESPIDPTTITHLYLTPKAGDWRISPLMMTDKSNLQSVVLLDPEGNGLTVERYAFSFFPNLTSVDMSKVTVNMELEVFFHTAIRSFTLPDGTADECLFQQCYTIEEIKNPTQNDVTLVIHHEEVTIPAGETWYADFGIASDKTYCVPGQPLQEQLYAVGADESQPLVWSLDSDYYYANPEGITLSEDGILSGISPQDVEYVYVVVTNGEQTAKGSVYLNTGGVFSVTTELPQGISVKSGPVGENLCSYRQEAAFVFDVDPDYFFPEGTVLVPTVYTINDEGEQDLLSPQNYVFYNDILFLPACTTERDLHIRMDVDYPSLSLEEAIEQAAPITFPYSAVIEQAGWVDIDEDTTRQSKVFSVDVKRGQKVSYSLNNPDLEYSDTVLYVYINNDLQELSCLHYIDNDMLENYGESGYIYALQDATYYFVASCFSDVQLNGCTFTLSVENNDLIPTNPNRTTPLDFVYNEPIPDQDALWSWDAETNTLTLKDGFSMDTEYEGICLPQDATILVEGRATIFTEYDAIWGEKNLTVNLQEKGNLSVMSMSGNALCIAEGTLKVSGHKGKSRLVAYAYYEDAVVAGSIVNEHDESNDSFFEKVYVGNIEIDGCTVTIECLNDAIEAIQGDITISDCDMTIDAGSDGILLGSSDYGGGRILIKNCNLNLNCSDSAIDNDSTETVTLIDCNANLSGYPAISSYGDVMVIGGKLMAKGLFEAPVFDLGDEEVETSVNVTFEDAKIYLQTAFSTLFYGNVNTITIDGKTQILDDEGNLLANGFYSDELYNDLLIQAEESDAPYPQVIRSAVIGDTDRDLEVTAADALEVLKAVVGKTEINGADFINADVDGDAELAAADALDILKKVVGKIDSFSVETEA